MKAVMTAYRAGDYETAIEKAEKLKDGAKKTPEYCCVAVKCCITQEGLTKRKRAFGRPCPFTMTLGKKLSSTICSLQC